MNKKTITLAILILTSFSIFGAEEKQPNPVKIEISPKTQLATINVKINNVDCLLLLDTGASHTTLDADFFKNSFPYILPQKIQLLESNLDSGAPKYAVVQKFEIGKDNLGKSPVMILPLKHLAVSMNQPVVGILGINTMSYRPFLLDMKTETVTWQEFDAEQLAKCEKLKTQPLPQPGEPTGVYVVESQAVAKPFNLLVDSGASYTFINESDWGRASSTNNASTFQAVGINNRDPEKAVSKFNRLESAVLTFLPKTKLREISPYVNTRGGVSLLGSDLLQTMKLYFEPVKHDLYFVPNEIQK